MCVRCVVFVCCCVCRGSASVLMKASLEHMPALMLLVIQLVFSNAFLFILLAWRRPPLPSRQLIIIFLGVGFMAPGLAYLLTTIGLSMTSVTSETLIFSTETMMIIVLSWLFLNEPLTRSIVMLSSLALVGIVLVTCTLVFVCLCVVCCLCLSLRICACLSVACVCYVFDT